MKAAWKATAAAFAIARNHLANDDHKAEPAEASRKSER